ncbi:MAG: helix-turn-helix transcriptional regulator [Bacteroidia bacterium]|nr:helix-turn-helix transcriptional regulator [Bacteroidia bacterium]
MKKTNDTVLPQIGKKIRKLREMNDYSQEFIAHELNMSISGYSRIERDEVKLTLDKLYIICKILDISIDELIKSSEGKTPSQNKYPNKEIEPINFENSNANYVEEIYKDQIKTLKEELRYLREILSRMTK